jgi:hypothetical protein
MLVEPVKVSDAPVNADGSVPVIATPFTVNATQSIVFELMKVLDSKFIPVIFFEASRTNALLANAVPATTSVRHAVLTKEPAL